MAMAMASPVIVSGCPALRLRPRKLARQAMFLDPTEYIPKLRLKQNKVKIFQGGELFNCKRLGLAMVSPPLRNPDPSAGSFSPAKRVKEFYRCINEKNMKVLEEIVSEDCYVDDFSFPKPFEGKKEVLRFFKELTASMGKNVKFIIRNIEEDEGTAWVNWHLEWKGRQIPFTRGCSFYEFSREEQTLIMRKAQVIIESPIKPGGVVLVLLKTVTSFFDEFPQAAEWFLKSQHIIGWWAEQIYAIFVVPLTKPILESYVHLWKLVTQILAYTISIFIFWLKFFFN